MSLKNYCQSNLKMWEGDLPGCIWESILHAKNSSLFSFEKFPKPKVLYVSDVLFTLQSSYLSCFDKNLCLELICKLKMYAQHLFKGNDNHRVDEVHEGWQCCSENESTSDNTNLGKVACKRTKPLCSFMPFNDALPCRSVVWLEPWKINGACSKNSGSAGRVS